MRLHLVASSLTLVASSLTAQSLTRADSLLIGQILLAEDRRDSTAAELGAGVRHADQRIQLLARRAMARISDPRFAARDSMPPAAAAPVYPEPAWRLRWRAVVGNRNDCAAMGAALADSAWHVRLRAADSVSAGCKDDAVVMKALRDWVARPAPGSRRTAGGASWQPAGHALVALARISPADARDAIPKVVGHPSPFLRAYVARAARMVADTATLRRLARDNDDNVKEAAIEALSRVAGHAADDAYLAALSARGYQAARAAARALQGSPRGIDVLRAALNAHVRLHRDSSETSRDARRAVAERITEFARTLQRLTPEEANTIATVRQDFDCEIAKEGSKALGTMASRTPPVDVDCKPLPITLPTDAVRLALGADVRIRVTMADSSGGGSFVVKLRGDVAPIMAARVLALARDGWYNGRTWHRVEPDFVVQGGGGGSEYIGYPRFFRDELGTIPHPRGSIGMSTRGHDTGDAQWFFNLRDNARLTRDYTVFAEVVSGIEVVDGILEGDVIAKMEVLPAR